MLITRGASGVRAASRTAGSVGLSAGLVSDALTSAGLASADLASAGLASNGLVSADLLSDDLPSGDLPSGDLRRRSIAARTRSLASAVGAAAAGAELASTTGAGVPAAGADLAAAFSRADGLPRGLASAGAPSADLCSTDGRSEAFSAAGLSVTLFSGMPLALTPGAGRLATSAGLPFLPASAGATTAAGASAAGLALM
uniref:Uncharacterized protein n=1 Tax=Bradyrhizobium amphicarpaeae TaxID=1404768 RepID=A0A2U8PZT3_9BRAD|nr:hypothetical protein CIT40_26870 [Bradyrhizobium amphicarpaeae]